MGGMTDRVTEHGAHEAGETRESGVVGAGETLLPPRGAYPPGGASTVRPHTVTDTQRGTRRREGAAQHDA